MTYLTTAKEIGLPEVQANVTSTDTEQDKRPITAQEFIEEQVENLYCLQGPYTV